MTMLLVLLVGGVATTLTVTIKTTGPTGVPIAALVCFLVGLVFIGISQVITNEFLWRFTFRLSAYRSGILQSEIDTETLSASVKPTGTLRIPTYFGYAAFIIWSIGAALTVLALANHTVTAASTGLERPAASPPLTVAPSTQAPESITSAPPTNTKGIAPLPTATSEAIQLADKIAIAAVLVGLIQAVALIVTFGVTRSTARRQLRAYVFAEAFDLIDGAIATPIQHARAGVPGAVLSIKNQGATPAYNVRSQAKIDVIEPINEGKLALPPLADAFGASLAPGIGLLNSPWFDRVLTNAEIADISMGVRAIYVHGRIAYVDAFNKKHLTTFRLRYSGVFPPSRPMGLTFSAQGNEAD